MEEQRNEQKKQNKKERIKEANENPETLMERQNLQNGRDISTIDRQEGNLKHGTTGGDFSNTNQKREGTTRTAGKRFSVITCSIVNSFIKAM